MVRTIFTLLFVCLQVIAFGQKFYLFTGTYTDKGSKGIYVYEFDATTGKATWVSNTEGMVNPSYLAVAPNRKYLYAVTETAKQNAGSVSAFSFDNSSGKLTFLNKQLSGGDNPCYVSVHKSGSWIVLGNYSGGSLSALKVNEDGSLQPPAQSIQHTGSGVNKERQEKAHVHSTVFSPDYQYLFAPDLGIDKVMIYKFSLEQKQPLQPAAQRYMTTEPGNGPRHFTFHPNGRIAYLVEEMSGTVAVYNYNKGKLGFVERLATHKPDYKGDIGSADIHLSPDGKFLYVSNRGNEHNIAIFSVHTRSGKLKSVGYQSTLGKVPRNFTIDPTGNYLLVANQSTDNIVIFKRNRVTGLLTATGEEIKVPTPVCLQMILKQ